MPCAVRPLLFTARYCAVLSYAVLAAYISWNSKKNMRVRYDGEAQAWAQASA